MEKTIKNNIKDIALRKNEIESFLTEAEIFYNKKNFIKKKYKLKIKKLEKEKFNFTPEGINLIKEKIVKNEESIKKWEEKLISLKDKEFDSGKEKSQKKFGITFELNKRNKNLKSLKKSLKKYTTKNSDSIDKKISILNSKNEKMQPELDKRKKDVLEYRKKYKAIVEEWKKEIPNYNETISLSIRNLNVFYDNKQSLFDVSIDFPKNQVISIIGPSGCGKSTFLKTLNRINDEIPSFRAEGKIILDSEIDVLATKNLYNPSLKVTLPHLRTKIGMVFQQPNPFPMSIYDNITYGPRINGIKNKATLKEIVNDSLKQAALFEQVKDNLNALATGLSGGQQQRLCIARAIANKPEIILMDEPTSALDPIAAAKVEDLILSLKKYYTIIMVTHSMQQAARISDKTAFFYQGKLIEYDSTKKIFTKPKEKKTDDYIRGKFG